MPKRNWACLGAICIVIFAHQGVAQDIDTSIFADNQAETYERCLAAVEIDAEAALEMASRWEGLDGDDPARHCRALALRRLGDLEEAGQLLASLADMPNATAPVKAGLWHQTGQVYSEARLYRESVDAFTQALRHAPDLIDARLDRAIANAALEDYWLAIDDLNVLTDSRPTDVTAYILRSGAYRNLGLTDLARDDLERGLAINPDNPDAWLERGLLAESTGQSEQASAAWLRVLQLAPDSVAADIARAHIEASALGTADLDSDQKSKSE